MLGVRGWMLGDGAGGWVLGLGSPLGFFAQRGPTEDGDAWRGVQGVPKSYIGRGVGFAVEAGIVLGLSAGLLGAVAEDPGASPSWWHREATACPGRVSAPPRRSHPMQTLQANCCGAGGQPEAPKSSRASTRAPACCLPLTSSLLFLAPPLHSSGGRGEEPSAATSAQSRWHARGGGSPATSRTAKNY